MVITVSSKRLSAPRTNETVSSFSAEFIGVFMPPVQPAFVTAEQFLFYLFLLNKRITAKFTTSGLPQNLHLSSEFITVILFLIQKDFTVSREIFRRFAISAYPIPCVLHNTMFSISAFLIYFHPVIIVKMYSSKKQTTKTVKP